jgi:hypothetical protein
MGLFWPIPGAGKVAVDNARRLAKECEEASKNGTLDPWQEGRAKAGFKFSIGAGLAVDPVGTVVEFVKLMREK